MPWRRFAMAKRPRGARLGHDGRDIAMLVGPDGAALLALMYPGTNVRSESTSITSFRARASSPQRLQSSGWRQT
jgi:hypothetical protein